MHRPTSSESNNVRNRAASRSATPAACRTAASSWCTCAICSSCSATFVSNRETCLIDPQLAKTESDAGRMQYSGKTARRSAPPIAIRDRSYETSRRFPEDGRLPGFAAGRRSHGASGDVVPEDRLGLEELFEPPTAELAAVARLLVAAER